MQTFNFTYSSTKTSFDYYPYGKLLRSYQPNGERYLTTQHERGQETEVDGFQGTGLDNRGARFYDSDVARFLSLDPASMDYPTSSDYVYVAGNPVMFIDPDGKRLILAQKNRQEAFAYLQRMTSDELILKANGEVLIKTRTPNPERPAGTELLASVIDAEKMAYFSLTNIDPNKNETINTTKPHSRTKMVKNKPTSAYLNVSTKSEDIKLTNGKDGKSNVLGTIANELSHAKRILNGKVPIAPDGNPSELEEVYSVLDENLVRKEDKQEEFHQNRTLKKLPFENNMLKPIENIDESIIIQ